MLQLATSSIFIEKLIGSSNCGFLVLALLVGGVVGFGTAAASDAKVYDLIIIGAGASGLFASGAARLAGQKCCLIEKSIIGGDCTNSACVPSKALRSSCTATYPQARLHMDATVQKVRAREDPDRIGNVTDLFFGDCRFIGPHEVEIQAHNETNCIRLYGKKFLLATGASPVVPEDFQSQAKDAKMPLLTYRSLLNPESATGAVESGFLHSLKSDHASTKRLLIVGGGATACELASSLAKLVNLNITLVAPALIPEEDVPLQEAALNLLIKAGVNEFLFNVKVAAILPDKSIRLSNGSVLPAFDAVLLCVGRKPSLESLDLRRAGIEYTECGVTVHPRTLQSVSARHVYASGDCASAIPPRFRTASQAAWTGFHAVRNAALPRILTAGGTAVHGTTPRLIYTQPELACVGLTLAECIGKYGPDGFDVLYCPEIGSDRADMDSVIRDPRLSFVELRAAKGGRILGLTTCGPAAAELANSMGLAISSKLTTRDVARSIFGYPSHGYLLQRVALSMALKDVAGLLDACGPVGKLLGTCGRAVQSLQRMLKTTSARRAHAATRSWLAEGAQKTIYPDRVVSTATDYIDLVSYYSIWKNGTLTASIEQTTRQEEIVMGTRWSKERASAYLTWARRFNATIRQ